MDVCFGSAWACRQLKKQRVALHEHCTFIYWDKAACNFLWNYICILKLHTHDLHNLMGQCCIFLNKTCSASLRNLPSFMWHRGWHSVLLEYFVYRPWWQSCYFLFYDKTAISFFKPQRSLRRSLHTSTETLIEANKIN